MEKEQTVVEPGMGLDFSYARRSNAAGVRAVAEYFHSCSR